MRFKMHFMLRRLILSHALHTSTNPPLASKYWFSCSSVILCLFRPGVLISNLNCNRVWSGKMYKIWAQRNGKIRLEKKATARLEYAICVHSHLFAFSSARKRLNILNQPQSRVYISFFWRWCRYHLFIFLFLIHSVVSSGRDTTSAKRVAWPLILYNLSSSVDGQKYTYNTVEPLTLTAPLYTL